MLLLMAVISNCERGGGIPVISGESNFSFEKERVLGIKILWT